MTHPVAKSTKPFERTTFFLFKNILHFTAYLQLLTNEKWSSC